MLPVLSFWPRVQLSEANRPCFFVRISRSPFLKGRRVTSPAIPGHTHRGREAAVYQALCRSWGCWHFLGSLVLRNEEAETQRWGPVATDRSGGGIPRAPAFEGLGRPGACRQGLGSSDHSPTSGELLRGLPRSEGKRQMDKGQVPRLAVTTPPWAPGEVLRLYSEMTVPPPWGW